MTAKSLEPLPEFWPDAPPPAPARAWWIPWPLAVLLVPLLWLMPKRMGPHFAAVRWPGVIIGHLFWTIYGIGCLDLAIWGPSYTWVAWLTGRSPGQADPSLWMPPTASEIFRAPLALEAAWLAEEVITGLPMYFLALGAWAFVELAIAADGLLLMPYATAGERTSLLMKRCIKLTLWSTTSVVLLGLAVQAAVVLAPPAWPHKKALVIAICAVYVAWFLWFWLCSGSRYAGPAEGPGWQPRRPSCERCSYTLTGLTPADRCPECGREVALSMPDHRRPTAYQAARGLARVPAFFRTATAVLTNDTYFERIGIHGAYPDARRFTIRMGLLGSGLAAPIALSGPVYYAVACGLIDVDGPVEWAAVFLLIWMTLFAATLYAGAMAALWRSRLGSRSIQPAAVAPFYHSVSYVPALVLPIWTVGWLYTAGDCTPHLPFPYTLVTSAAWATLVAIASAVLTVVAFVLNTAGESKATRRTRFANG